MNKNLKKLSPVLLGLAALALTGCAQCTGDECAKPVVIADIVESLDSKGFGMGEGRTSDGMLPIYFSFDASKVRSDQQPRMQGNADFLKANPQHSIRIEGNTDPRGTEEYNMALGERRALTAQKYLIGLGIDKNRLSTISYGEERITFSGQNEEAWEKNRRADFVIVK